MRSLKVESEDEKNAGGAAPNPHGDAGLPEYLRGCILREGPVTFRLFMEQALYHPEHGYYASGRAAPGRQGDYFTNVSVGPLFGKLLAGQFREMWERMGRPAEFTIVEQGAGDFFAAIRYVIVEPFPVLEGRQRQRLADFPEVKWAAGVAELDNFRGVHFSNELVDAMPVHLVKFTGGAWRERYVDLKDGGFEFIEGPLSSPELDGFLEKLPRIAVEGYTTEINLEALDWIASLAERLEAGYALIVDYGWARDSYYAEDRTTGTLACYSEHKRSFDPLVNAGNADITARVDFTSLAERAEAAGFRVAGFADQHHFMVGLGKTEFPDTDEPADEARMKAMRAFKTLMHPTLMGLAFKFLALQKSVPAGEDAPLAGFQFSSNARVALGL